MFINLDSSVDVERELLEGGFSEEIIKSFLLIGYSLYKHQVLRQVGDLIEKNIESVIDARVQDKFGHELLTLQNENVTLAKELETKEAILASKYELELQKQQIALHHKSSVLEETRGKCKALEEKIENMYKTVLSDSMQQLKDQIRQKELEISMLKNTNTVKGQIGEHMLATALKNIWTEAEVCQVGKIAHICDVHMTLPDQGKIVFESKFKGCIDKKDVDKFYKDMEGMGEDVIGGMFVSFLSKNIPNKGSLHFEVTQTTKTPIMYVAYEGEHEFSLYFAHHVTMFHKLCMTFGRRDRDEDIDGVVEHLKETIKFISDMLTRNKKRMDDIKFKFTKYTTEAEEDTRQMMAHLDQVLKMTHRQHAQVKTQKLFVCNTCQFSCKTKRTLDKHHRDTHNSES